MSPKIYSQKNRKDLIDRSAACIALIWLGMVLGISFLEAPVKFMAPSVTREIGLDIGRYVFGIFNKVECVFALVIAIMSIITRRKHLSLVPLGLAWLSLALQTAWLLPVLEAVVQAGRRRFRPVMLTTLTTVGGLTPGEEYLFQAYWSVKSDHATRKMNVRLEGNDLLNIDANPATAASSATLAAPH